MTLFPIRLLLPDGNHRRGAVKAKDWAAGLAYLQRQYPGAIVTADAPAIACRQ